MAAEKKPVKLSTRPALKLPWTTFFKAHDKEGTTDTLRDKLDTMCEGMCVHAEYIRVMQNILLAWHQKAVSSDDRTTPVFSWYVGMPDDRVLSSQYGDFELLCASLARVECAYKRRDWKAVTDAVDALEARIGRVKAPDCLFAPILGGTRATALMRSAVKVGRIRAQLKRLLAAPFTGILSIRGETTMRHFKALKLVHDHLNAETARYVDSTEAFPTWLESKEVALKAVQAWSVAKMMALQTLNIWTLGVSEAKYHDALRGLYERWNFLLHSELPASVIDEILFHQHPQLKRTYDAVQERITALGLLPLEGLDVKIREEMTRVIPAPTGNIDKMLTVLEGLSLDARPTDEVLLRDGT